MYPHPRLAITALASLILSGCEAAPSDPYCPLPDQTLTNVVVGLEVVPVPYDEPAKWLRVSSPDELIDSVEMVPWQFRRQRLEEVERKWIRWSGRVSMTWDGTEVSTAELRHPREPVPSVTLVLPSDHSLSSGDSISFIGRIVYTDLTPDTCEVSMIGIDNINVLEHEPAPKLVRPLPPL